MNLYFDKFGVDFGIFIVVFTSKILFFNFIGSEMDVCFCIIKQTLKNFPIDQAMKIFPVIFLLFISINLFYFILRLAEPCRVAFRQQNKPYQQKKEQKMKTFSKALITVLLISLFVVSPIFAQDYVYKVSGDSPNNDGIAASATSTVLGPFSVIMVDGTGATKIVVYLQKGSDTSSLTLSGPGGYSVLLGNALALKCSVYLFLAADNSVSNIALMY